MKKLITDAQKMEIGKLGIDGHADALIALGADMYRQGIVRGAVYATVGITLGILTNTMLNGLFKKKPKTSAKNITKNVAS